MAILPRTIDKRPSYRVDDVILSGAAFSGVGGGSASATIAIRITRIGRLVTLEIPGLATVVPTGGSIALQITAAMPIWARPSVGVNTVVTVVNNNATVNTTLGRMEITTAGLINIYRDWSNTAFTDSQNAGWRGPVCVSYFA